MGDGDLGRTSVLRHKIDTGDAAPIHSPQIALPSKRIGANYDKGDARSGYCGASCHFVSRFGVPIFSIPIRSVTLNLP